MSGLRSYGPMKRASGLRSRPGQIARSPRRRGSDEAAGSGDASVTVRGTQARGDDPVYAEVDLRSGLRCEVQLEGVRCRLRQQDHHHTRKPRQSHHEAWLIIGICRIHHERCDWPYQRGKLVIQAVGAGVFECRILTAASKFTLRDGGASCP